MTAEVVSLDDARAAREAERARRAATATKIRSALSNLSRSDQLAVVGLLILVALSWSRT